jgi:hypothetical protein
VRVRLLPEPATDRVDDYGGSCATFDVSDLQVNVTDVDARIDRVT